MDIKEVQNINFVANRHPWELARVKIIENFVQKVSKQQDFSKISIIDIGCGDLFVLKTIRKHFQFSEFFGVDVALTAENLANLENSLSETNIKVFNNLNDISAKSNNMVIVLLNDVIEHIADDKTFLLHLQKHPSINSDSVFTLYEMDAVVKGPQLVEVSLAEENQISLKFDKPIGAGTLKRSDFKFHSIKKIGIESALIDENSPDVVVLTLSANVTPGDYITVSYFPGNLAATDNSKAGAFGPEPIAIPASTVGIPQLNNNSVKVYPNPAGNNISIVSQSAPFNLAIFNVLGKQVYQVKSDTENLNIDVSGFDRGLYLVRITDTNGVINVQKILLK